MILVSPFQLKIVCDSVLYNNVQYNGMFINCSYIYTVTFLQIT